MSLGHVGETPTGQHDKNAAMLVNCAACQDGAKIADFPGPSSPSKPELARDRAYQVASVLIAVTSGVLSRRFRRAGWA